jgi:hypothetical protein
MITEKKTILSAKRTRCWRSVPKRNELTLSIIWGWFIAISETFKSAPLRVHPLEMLLAEWGFGKRGKCVWRELCLEEGIVGEDSYFNSKRDWNDDFLKTKQYHLFSNYSVSYNSINVLYLV